MVSETEIRRIIDETADRLSDVIELLFKRLHWAKKTRDRLNSEKSVRLLEKEEEELIKRCDRYISNILMRHKSTYTLTTLGTEGFLPGYGVYEGGITAYARGGFGRNYGKLQFDLNRSKAVALREFLPGNKLYANRGSFYVSQYRLGADTNRIFQTLSVDPVKGFVKETASASGYGQSGLITVDSMPISDANLSNVGRITDNENLRFSMPSVIAGRLRRQNRGGQAYKIGEIEVEHIRGQATDLVNLGEAGRARKGELGYLICTVCGAVKSPYVVELEKSRFIDHHNERCGRNPSNIVLSASVNVDLLRFVKIEDLSSAINIGETLRYAASNVLEMGYRDLQVLPIAREDESYDLLLYDPMPGGSGLLDQMLKNWMEIIKAAYIFLDCPQKCDKACYNCLKSYGNQFHHDLLDRHRSIDLINKLKYIPDGYRTIEPVFEDADTSEGDPSNPWESRLNQMLEDHNFPSGKLRETVVLKDFGGMRTVPDWLYIDQFNLQIKVAIYLDSMSPGLHGSPEQIQKDKILRMAMEASGYKVFVIQSRDLDDPEIMRNHLRTMGEAIGQSNTMN